MIWPLVLFRSKEAAQITLQFQVKGDSQIFQSRPVSYRGFISQVAGVN